MLQLVFVFVVLASVLCERFSYFFVLLLSCLWFGWNASGIVFEFAVLASVCVNASAKLCLCVVLASVLCECSANVFFCCWLGLSLV